MKKCLFLVYLYLCLSSCAKHEDSFKGTYGMVDYFSPIDTHTGYAYPFLLNINDSLVTAYGTMPFWGVSSGYSKNGDTLKFSGKFYRDILHHNSFVYETFSGDKTIKVRFEKMDGLDVIIDKEKSEVDNEELASFLNKSLFEGKYLYDGKVVEFYRNGSVVGINDFSIFTTLPRQGTLTSYDDCIIKTNGKDIWKYGFQNNQLLLTRYTNERDSLEQYILSNKQIRLRKISHDPNHPNHSR